MPHAPLGRDVHFAQRSGADDAVWIKTVPRLESPHPPLDFRAVNIRRRGRSCVRQVTRRDEAPRNNLNPGVQSARSQRRTLRHRRPTAGRGDATVARQGVAHVAIEPAPGNQLLHVAPQRRRGDRVPYFGHRVRGCEPAIEIPLRIECVRVYLAEALMISKPRQRVGQQDVQLGSLSRGQRA